MLTYARQKSGYSVSQGVVEFKNVNQVNFNLTRETCESCVELAFIVCVHREKTLCIYNVFRSLHFHDNLFERYVFIVFTLSNPDNSHFSTAHPVKLCESMLKF